MYIHFQLNPIAEIEPWGKKENLNLHWFGLSDGHYWIKIGETELLRYNNASLSTNPPQDTTLATHPLWPYADYFVVRLWEDILGIMADIIDPLPTQLLQRMEPIDEWLQWCKRVARWSWGEDDDDDEMIERRSEMHIAALNWWWDRQLTTAPILPEPGTSFWSDGQSVHCLWDCQDTLSEDGISTWEAVFGTAIMPMATFIDAVTSFDTRFIAAMAERVQIVSANWSRPEIELDLDHLALEQVQRSEHFARCMAAAPTKAKSAAEWEQILAAIAAIESDPDFVAMS